ncbi:hypothetical protein SDC9_204718 [bioreactor metagenome]|uniref:Uncharacterized protein n=1 Tax=bioreactor metagenome TaxID=1076179 RepID=A0A645J966_9ZZZZ
MLHIASQKSHLLQDRSAFLFKVSRQLAQVVWNQLAPGIALQELTKPPPVALKHADHLAQSRAVRFTYPVTHQARRHIDAVQHVTHVVQHAARNLGHAADLARSRQ